MGNIHSYDNYGLANYYLEKRMWKEVVEILEVDKFYFVGHSMGGMIAWRYALDNLDQLNGLIIIGAAFFGNEQEFKDFQTINAPPLAFETLKLKLSVVESIKVKISGPES